MNIWCVEDDDSIRDIEIYALKHAGFEAKGFRKGSDMLELLKKSKPDLIILDIMLPEISGITILKTLKSDMQFQDIPIILATAKGEEYDKVIGLDIGADYYLVKPFGVMELISCVNAVLRRYKSDSECKRLQMKDLVVNIDEHTVFVEGERIDLTLKEFNILTLFLKNPNVVYTRNDIFRNAWGDEPAFETRTVDMHIVTLRKKIGEYGKYIRTIRGVGYCLEMNYD